MEMYFVLLHFNREAVVLPDKYPKDQCEQIIKDYSAASRCIPAPKLDSYCAGNIPNTPYVFSYPCYTTTGK